MILLGGKIILVKDRIVDQSVIFTFVCSAGNERCKFQELSNLMRRQFMLAKHAQLLVHGYRDE